MTGYQVAAAGLLAYGRGSRDAADNFGQLASLLEQARVSDDCFGPIGELLAFTYFDSLQECQDLANAAKAFLEDVAERVTETARTYQDNDAQIEVAFDTLDDGGSGPGSFADLVTAGHDERKSDFEQAASYGSSWASTAGDVARASSPPDIAIAAVNTRLEQLQLITSPGQSLIDNGLGFLIALAISPIVETILEPAIGDPEQMRSTAKGWEKVAEWLESTGEHETGRAQATSELWQGEAGDAFRQQLAEFGAGATAFASEIRGLQQTLEIAADLFDAFVEICVDTLQELVMGLIIEWLAALAASWITAGASVGAATAATTSQVAIVGGRLGAKAAQLLGRLMPLIRRLEDLLQKLRSGPLKQVVERAQDLRDNGGWLQKKVVGAADKNPLFKITTSAEPTVVKKAGLDGRMEDVVVQATRTTNKSAAAFGIQNGESALAAEVAKVGLGIAGLSGTTDPLTAGFRGVLENVPGTVIEQAVRHGYDQAQDPSTKQERREATDRGFQYE
ncbi:WXG100 family type VII secretion target [Goodfellowiella coeruleoviolacea]|uniref:Outer membrane channel protein CpnT-like N-terminal domain-containing protein n=1 Tax=Goodfellowiella coeruleoviolacea TaxID=334858 RepID=A0AAE3KEX9_9PSEU|nr:WXG100 family type VII secretion target [Goodfellowiella coeruleoviolacea]MCP2165786.1 hypothetical protein [Goodfellowiella coeruleoviolacea]